MLLLIVQFTGRFHDAFVQNNVSMAIMILIEEKSSVSLTDRLDEVVIKAGFEFAFSEFPNLFCYFVRFSTAKVDLSYGCKLYYYTSSGAA